LRFENEPKVYGESKKLARLRILNLSTGISRTLVSLPSHIYELSWSSDGNSIIFLTSSSVELEFRVDTQIQIVSFQDGSIKLIKSLKRSAVGIEALLVLTGDKVFYKDTYTSQAFVDSYALKTFEIGDPESSVIVSPKSGNEDVDSLRLLSNGDIAVTIISGLDSSIDILDSKGINPDIRLYKTQEDGIGSLDLVSLKDGNYALAAVKSSCIRNELPQVWFGLGKRDIKLEKKLSNHYSDLEEKFSSIKTELFKWNANDGTYLEGLISYPTSHKLGSVKLPTILHPHGGPYSRDTFAAIKLGCTEWKSLASHGFLVISPNYRGSELIFWGYLWAVINVLDQSLQAAEGVVNSLKISLEVWEEYSY
jgi:hypothetical protein